MSSLHPSFLLNNLHSLQSSLLTIMAKINSFFFFLLLSFSISVFGLSPRKVTDPPVVNPLFSGTTVVSGSSSAPSGSAVYVFVDSVFLGATVVSSTGAWVLTGITPLVLGRTVTAAVTDTLNDKEISEQSTAVVVQEKKLTDTAPLASAPEVPSPPSNNAVSSIPEISVPLLAGSEIVSGTSVDNVGTAIYVYVNDEFMGATTVRNDRLWSLSGMAPLSAGQKVAASAIDVRGNKAMSARFEVVVSDASGRSVSERLLISGPIHEGESSVRGISSEQAGSAVYVFVDSKFVGATMVDGVGTWVLKGVRPLTVGQVVSAKGPDSADSSPGVEATAVVFASNGFRDEAESPASPDPAITPIADPDGDFFSGNCFLVVAHF